MNSLVDRLDSRFDVHSSRSDTIPPRHEANGSSSSTELNQAPVSLIQDVATDVGVRSPQQSDTYPDQQSDVISSGLITIQNAYTMLSLFVTHLSASLSVSLIDARFRVHYGRWVKFNEYLSTEKLLLQVRKSPLLLCSICLIAVRHTTQDLAAKLAPSLFKEAKSLVASSLLTVPQSIEFFQATLILSLWSTTIGQVPLSIDSWLLTGYALQQALASSHFNEVLRPDPRPLTSRSHLDAWCIWNHLCVAHLQ